MSIRNKLFFISLLALLTSSCSNTEQETNDLKIKSTNWHRIYRAGGTANVYRVSLTELKIDRKNKAFLKKYYNLLNDFNSPTELIKSLEHAGHKAKIKQQNGLSWIWHPKKYQLSDIVLYNVVINKNGNLNNKATFSYINKEHFNIIRECFIIYSKNIGTLSSQKCLSKYIVK